MATARQQQQAPAEAEAEVRCVDFWCNEFGMRARIALREHRVPFEYVEEDLRVRERSNLVVRMNPVHRHVPILIHHGRPVCESMNIVEYVDEVWGHRSGDNDGTARRLVPADPFERARARFWAHFVDDKVYPAQTRLFTTRGGADDQKSAAAATELRAHLRVMEGVLGDDKPFFGGDEFGLLDVAFVPFSSMFYGYQRYGGVDVAAEFPALTRWVDRCGERESVRSVLPSGVDMYEIHKEFYGIQ